MGALFDSPSAPPPPAPPPAAPPAPTLDTAKSSQKSQDMMSARRGRAADILTSAQGDLSSTETSKTTLGG